MKNLLTEMTKIELDAEREKQMNNEKISETERHQRIELINTITLKTNTANVKER